MLRALGMRPGAAQVDSLSTHVKAAGASQKDLFLDYG